jgi:hypothetical protein
MKVVLNVLRWAISIILALFVLGGVKESGFVFALFNIIAIAIVLPVTSKHITKFLQEKLKINKTRTVKIIACLVLLIIGMAMAKSSSTVNSNFNKGFNDAMSKKADIPKSSVSAKPCASTKPNAKTTQTATPAPVSITKPITAINNSPIPTQKIDFYGDAIKNAKWNKSDINAKVNGNISKALDVVEFITTDYSKQNYEVISAQDVMKTPWDYYGKIIKFSGKVGIIQSYPGDDEVTRTEVVFMTDDGTYIDYLNANTEFVTEDVVKHINKHDQVTVYGFPTGIIEGTNQMGGISRELALVGCTIEKE